MSLSVTRIIVLFSIAFGDMSPIMLLGSTTYILFNTPSITVIEGGLFVKHCALLVNSILK